MPYSPAQLASFTPELREDADEAMRLLTQFADCTSAADMWPLEGRILQIAKRFDLCGWGKECEAITAAYNALHSYVRIRCQHAYDAESRFSIPNHYPEGHPVRVRYEARVAGEKKALEGYPTARKGILARAGFVLSGTVLDATLERLRTEPLTAPVVAGSVRLSDAVREAGAA